MPMKTSIFLLTFVVVGLNAHDPASADHKFTCAPHDQNGARLPYDGPFICGQIYVFRADCEHLRKTRGVPVLNNGRCFNFMSDEARAARSISDDDDSRSGGGGGGQ